MFKKEKKEEEKKPEAEKSAEEKSPAFTIPLGEKKAEKPFIEKFQEALKKTDIVLAESRRSSKIYSLRFIEDIAAIMLLIFFCKENLLRIKKTWERCKL